MILKVVNYLVLGFINLYSLYFFITGLGYFKKKKNEQIKNKKKNHFTILLPARNEENVISNLIDSLKKQDYDNYDIYVVLNNSTDNTLDVVKKLGVNIIECKNKITCKGDALKEALEVLKNQKTDAYAIFDSDNVVSSNFLSEMNKTLNNGYSLAQGFRDIKNTQNWLSNSYGIYFYIENMFYNEARNNIGKTAALSGTGFVVKKEVIEKIGYDVKTLTEDVEFTTFCILNDIKIGYAKKAIFFDEHPSELKISYKQRKRWSKGALQCLNLYFKELFVNFSKTKNISCLDMIFVHFAPFLQLITLIPFILMPIIYYKNIENIIIFSIIGSIVGYLAQVLLAFFVVKVNKKNVKNFLSGIVLFPLFILTWLPINFVILLKKEITWEHIEHKSSIKIEEM